MVPVLVSLYEVKLLSFFHLGLLTHLHNHPVRKDYICIANHLANVYLMSQLYCLYRYWAWKNKDFYYYYYLFIIIITVHKQEQRPLR